MASILSSYRETNPTKSRDEHRCLPSDSFTLANKTSPSPQSTPGSAHEPPAEYTSIGRTAYIADKRAKADLVGPMEPSSYPYLRRYQGSRQQASIDKIAVHEEEGGKLP